MMGSRTSLFPEGAVFEGEIQGDGDLTVCGTVIGPLRMTGTLTIEAGAKVTGGVTADSVIVRGSLEGPAHANALVRLESGCKMIGDAKAERVVLLEGALLRGRVTMGVRRGLPAATERSAAPAVSHASVQADPGQVTTQTNEDTLLGLQSGRGWQPPSARDDRGSDVWTGSGSQQAPPAENTEVAAEAPPTRKFGGVDSGAIGVGENAHVRPSRAREAAPSTEPHVVVVATNKPKGPPPARMPSLHRRSGSKKQ